MNITLIPGFNPGPYTGAGNNTYLIGGREPTLIDAGAGQTKHVQAVTEALAGAPLSRVLVTHGHPDHASGSPVLSERWPDAEFVKMPWPGRDEEFRVRWRAVGDQDLVRAGDGHLRVIHTPGHAPDHVCFLDEDSRTLFSGDLVIEGTTVVIPATCGGDLATYLTSLQMIRSLEPTRVLPAHGSEVEDLPKLVARYLDHRRRREQEILAALDAGERTPEAIVDRVYRQLPEPLRRTAGESVLAHLIKLRDEGRAREEDGEWCLR